jgi:aldehyde:ferredoxin oxidoreductase
MVFLTDLPDRYGLDLISLGNVVGWACEAQEKGILTAADLGGVQLKWGEADGFAKLMELIAYRKGDIPKLLGDGLLATTKKLGKGAEFAVICKGMELGAHGTRSLQDKDELGYTVSAMGGDHVSTVIADREDRFVADSTGQCTFLGLTRDQEVEILQATTGFGITKDELEKQLVYRWTTANRIPLLLAGWTYKDDVNPPRFYEPLPDGPYKGKFTDKTIEETKKQAYYKSQGWDTQGVPTTDTLKKCGLDAFDGALAPLRAKA